MIKAVLLLTLFLLFTQTVLAETTIDAKHYLYSNYNDGSEQSQKIIS